MASPEFSPLRRREHWETEQDQPDYTRHHKRRKTFPTPDEFPEATQSGRPLAAPPKVEVANAPISSSRISPEASPPLKSQDITFICPDGEKCLLPFESCRNWQGMRRLIRIALGHNLDISSFEDGHYRLYNSDDNVLLPDVWDKSIKPGDDITMRWSQQSQPQLRPFSPSDFTQARDSPAPESLVSQPAGPPTVSGISDLKAQKEQPVSFTFGGKTWSLPFHDCNTWESMEQCIKHACAFQKPWGRHDRHIEVQAYHLIYQTNGGSRIILPSSWENAVEPGWIVELQMQPLPEPTPVPQAEPAPSPENPPQQSQEVVNIPDHDAYLPSDAIEVIVEAKRDRKGGIVYKFPSPDDPNKDYSTQRQDWVRRQIRGTGEECFLYTGKKSGLHFYTLSLDSSRRSGSKKRKWD